MPTFQSHASGRTGNCLPPCIVAFAATAALGLSISTPPCASEPTGIMVHLLDPSQGSQLPALQDHESEEAEPAGQHYARQHQDPRSSRRPSGRLLAERSHLARIAAEDEGGPVVRMRPFRMGCAGA